MLDGDTVLAACCIGIVRSGSVLLPRFDRYLTFRPHP